MDLISALSDLVVLLDFSALLQGGGNVVNPSYSAQKINADTVRKKNNGFEDDIETNHRWLSTTSSWVEAATFPKLDDSQLGGNRISMSGDATVLAASPLFVGNNAGIVRFFEKQESDGSWREMINLRLTGEAKNDYFGSDFSLSDDGKRVAIGAEGDDGAFDELDYAGSVSVYEMNSDGSEWSLMGDVIHGKSKNGGSGSSVALSKDGSTVAIGAVLNDGTRDDPSYNSGYVRVYRWDVNASAFDQLGGDILGEVSGDYFGSSVALSEDGSVVAIGAPCVQRGSSCSSGDVHVLYWDENDGGEKKWSQRGSKIQGDASFRAYGSSVDLSADGSILAVGAPFAVRADGGTSDFGEAKVFQWKDDDWVKVGQTLESTVKSGEFGSSVSLSSDGSIVAAGSSVFTLVDNQWERLGGAVGSTSGTEVSLSNNGETLAVGYPDEDGAVTVYNLAIDDVAEPTSAPASAA
eukprot:scaffold4901_cov105-Cylindrotheca_fusiformis.AAC.1